MFHTIKTKLLLFCVLVACSFCNKETKESEVSSPGAFARNNLVKEEQDRKNFKSSEEVVRNEKNISFSREFGDFKGAIADYRKSEPYKNPSNDDDKTLNTVVDQANLITENFAKEQIQKGQFSKYQKRIDTKLSEYQEAAERIFVDIEDDTPESTDEDISKNPKDKKTNNDVSKNSKDEKTNNDVSKNSKDEKTGMSGEDTQKKIDCSAYEGCTPDKSPCLSQDKKCVPANEKGQCKAEETVCSFPSQKDGDKEKKAEDRGKTGLQQGTGIYLIVMGSLGALGNLFSKSATYGQINDMKVRTGGVTAGQRMFGLGMAAWALSVGILIVANDTPTEETIRAAQAYFGVSAVGAGLSSVVALGAGILVHTKLKGLEKELQKEMPSSRNTMKKIKGQPRPKNMPKFKKIQGEINKHKNARKGFGVGGVLMGGITAGLAIWSADLGSNLGLSELMSPQQIISSKIARFFIVAQKLEEEWRD